MHETCFSHLCGDQIRKFRLSFNRTPNCLLLNYANGGPVEVRAHLPKKASMHASRMHDVEIDRYPTISTSACVRNRRPRRTRPRPERRLACRACESGAAPSDSAEIRCRAVRSYGPRPHGFYGRHRGRHIGTSSMSSQLPKRSISPLREAPSAAAARCSPEVESAIRCRAAPSRPSRTPCEVGPTTARHRRCPFSPSGQGVETCKSAY